MRSICGGHGVCHGRFCVQDGDTSDPSDVVMAASYGKIYEGGAEMVFLTFLLDYDLLQGEVALASLPPGVRGG